jgi:hypothetical protein
VGLNLRKSAKILLNPLEQLGGCHVTERHLLEVIPYLILNGHELEKKSAGLFIMQYERNPSAGPQTVNRHHIRRYTGVAHTTANLHHRIDVLVGCLDAGMGIAGKVGEGFQGIFRHWNPYAKTNAQFSLISE